MLNSVVQAISARQAAAAVNEWLVSYVGDRFLAGTAVLDTASDAWHSLILYVYPGDGSLGSVGEVLVDAGTGEIRAHPPIDEIKRLASDLIQLKRDRDHSAVPPPRD